MVRGNEERTVVVDAKTHEMLVRAKKGEESLSDVIGRLAETKIAALQQRGEKEITTSDEKKLLVRIDQTACAGAESCVMVAPQVFSLDINQLGLGRKGSEPLGIKEAGERRVDSETIVTAAMSCPYRAIYVKDNVTGEVLVAR